MAIYVNGGEAITYTATKDIAYGDVVTIGANHIGVALENIANGSVGIVSITGVWAISAKQADKIDAGTDVFFNPTTGEIESSKGDSGVSAGIALTSKAASTTGLVEVKIG